MLEEAIPFNRTRFGSHPHVFACAELAVVKQVLPEQVVSGCPDLAHVFGDYRLTDHDHRIALPAAMRIMSAAFRGLGGGAGVVIGRALHLPTYGIPGFALLSAATLDDAIRFAVRHWPFFNLLVRVELVRPDAGRWQILLSERFGLPACDDQHVMTMQLAKLLMLCRDLAGPDCDAARIGSGGASDSAVAALRMTTRAEIVRDRGFFLEFPLSVVTAPLPLADAAAHRNVAQICDWTMTDLFSERPLIRRIKAQLAQLDTGVPTLSQIAAGQCMSERTLRRRLQEMGTSYYRLLDEVRLEMAESLLSDDDMTTDLIAERLGYAETTNFRYAFRRWTGGSPSKFRAFAGA